MERRDGRALRPREATLAKNPLGVAPDMYTPKCAPQRAACSGARHQARFASARAQGPGNSQVPPSCAPIICHEIKTKQNPLWCRAPLDSVFCALYFGVRLFTQLFVSFWESWCQFLCFLTHFFSATMVKDGQNCQDGQLILRGEATPSGGASRDGADSAMRQEGEESAVGRMRSYEQGNLVHKYRN